MSFVFILLLFVSAVVIALNDFPGRDIVAPWLILVYPILIYQFMKFKTIKALFSLLLMLSAITITNVIIIESLEKIQSINDLVTVFQNTQIIKIAAIFISFVFIIFIVFLLRIYNNRVTRISEEIVSDLNVYGNEVLKKPRGGIVTYIGGILFLILLLLVFSGKGSYDGVILFFALAVFVTSIGSILDKPSQARYERVNKVYQYFKKTFPVLNSYDPREYTVLNTINTTSTDSNIVNFDIYLQAYNLGADYIVINNSNTSTHVSGSVSSRSRNISSTNEFHANISFIKAL